MLAACRGPDPANGVAFSTTNLKAGPAIEGTVRLPGDGDGTPAANAVIQLTDPDENFFRANGKVIATSADRKGVYRIDDTIPIGVPVVVIATVSGARRLSALTVPDGRAQKVDLDQSTTQVMEFLRIAAKQDGKSLAAYAPEQLADLAAQTRGAINAKKLAAPDLAQAKLGELVRNYALAVGDNAFGLGDAWSVVLLRRVQSARTAAGTGQGGAPAGGTTLGDGGAATAAALYQPRLAITDDKGNMDIADGGNGRVRRVDARTGKITTIAGNDRLGFAGDGKVAVEALLAEPTAIARDTNGDLYIADGPNRRIRKVDAKTGVITTVVGNPLPDGLGGFQGTQSGDGGKGEAARLQFPRGLAIDTARHLFIADGARDTKVHVVRRLNLDTGVIDTAVGTFDTRGSFGGDGGDPTLARLNLPTQLAVDPQGRLLIADSDNHVVRRVDFTGKTIATIAGVGGDASDDPDGRAPTSTRFKEPAGVAVAKDGRIYIGDRATGKVHTIGKDGRVKTIVGLGTATDDGDTRDLLMKEPVGLWLTPDGDLLVAEAGAARIRRIVTRFGF